MLPFSNIATEMLNGELMRQKKISLSVLRLDKIHPVVSGNKLFKLHHFLENIQGHAAKRIITFGGAFSNHLVAVAYACKIKDLQCAGIVRGEKPARLSQTLLDCIEYGMQLHFISRNEYEKKENGDLCKQLPIKYPGCLLIPEGGYDTLGAKGAAQIMNFIDSSATHICCAAGTATTVAGLLINIKQHQQVIAIPVLKGLTDIEKRIAFLNGPNAHLSQLYINYQYHFGGYAKKTGALIQFMNALYDQYQLPTDFVYTAKMMYGIMDMIQNDFFAPGSAIVCVHTGGLQGNLSLQKGTLTYN